MIWEAQFGISMARRLSLISLLVLAEEVGAAFWFDDAVAAWL